jgi:hypothetical protein
MDLKHLPCLGLNGPHENSRELDMDTFLAIPIADGDCGREITILDKISIGEIAVKQRL